MLSTDTLLKKLLDTQDDVATQTGLVAAELKRLNDNLERGVVNSREHAVVCIAPPKGNYSIGQLNAMSKFVDHAIETGALVLPPKEAAEVEPAEAAVRS